MRLPTTIRSWRWRPFTLGAVIAALALLTAGCSRPVAASSGGLEIVAAENTWGSLAAQLAGPNAGVTDVVSNPAADPHDYEPTAADARAFAGANLVIVNGIGYDPWAARLLAANPVPGRLVLDVGKLLGIEAGGNPHRWYSPSDVRRVLDAVARDLAQLAPSEAASFSRRRAALEKHGLKRYYGLLASIRARYHGAPVGASESIVEPLVQALGLELLTPSSFLRASSEGAEPTAADRATIDDQIAHRRIAAWIFDRQNATPDVARITEAARRKGIPVVPVTETLVPAGATFQAWQTRQLQALARALAEGTSR